MNWVNHTVYELYLSEVAEEKEYGINRDPQTLQHIQLPESAYSNRGLPEPAPEILIWVSIVT